MQVKRFFLDANNGADCHRKAYIFFAAIALSNDLALWLCFCNLYVIELPTIGASPGVVVIAVHIAVLL